MEHLIADTGIHFISNEVEFNFSEPLVLSNGRPLKYAFCDTKDFITNQQIFDLLYYHSGEGVYIPLQEIKSDGVTVKLPDGRDEIDESGLQKMKPDVASSLYTNYSEEDNELISINSLAGYKEKNPIDGRTKISAFEILLNKWLPMPMFECEQNGYTNGAPLGWCRVKIERLGEGSKQNVYKYRFTWAFDTGLSNDPLTNLRPYFYEDEGASKEFCLCNQADQLLNFMSTDIKQFVAFSDYISSLLGLVDRNMSHKYIAFYIYFINYIRLIGASPQITLHHNHLKSIPVDLVLDIGNSRTCGVLFEQGDFTKAMMLELRNMTHPHMVYEKPFDMRLAFRLVDLGNDIVLENEDMFSWKSFVRVGDEAKNLVYRSLEEEGLSEQTTNYSSPKRYLWDNKKYDGKWEFLITEDDPFNIKLAKNIYIPILTDLFDERGNYIGNGSNEAKSTDTDGNTCYSRSSLMTFVLIEIFQQAIVQINSIKFRNKHGNVDSRRTIRNIILTCPTAMPIDEQIKLRQCASDAFDAICKCIPLEPATIIPSVESLKIADDYDESGKRSWSFDEASCCQLVYLYAEIAQRYSGEIHKFFELKGHVRPELVKEGYDRKALTIATIDIGAGTTDVMVCSYEYAGQGRSRLTPIPLFWDSFYLAGDDILRNIIQNLIIEGRDLGLPDMGNITSALTARILMMSDDDLCAIPSIRENHVYAAKVDDILRSIDNVTKNNNKRVLASNLIHDFFGQDSSMMGYKDRRCRVDFNTQISHPISQLFMELLRLNRPSKVYTYDEIFISTSPADYLLEYFAHHFGFSFKELKWRFDPTDVAEIVKATMEPLMKQLSVVLYTYHCDILVLGGRPTSLDAITELFVKYIPLSPNRLVRLNEYHVGQWFPFADGQGFFYDQKAVVAVGAMVGYLASKQGFNGMSLDFSRMIKTMKSTARYIGMYNVKRQQIIESFLTPENDSEDVEIAVFPAFIGCKQFNSPQYQSRPLYAIYNYTGKTPLTIRLARNYHESREHIEIEEITDDMGITLSKKQVKLIQQSLAYDENSNNQENVRHWLDKGEFELSIVELAGK